MRVLQGQGSKRDRFVVEMRKRGMVRGQRWGLGLAQNIVIIIFVGQESKEQKRKACDCTRERQRQTPGTWAHPTVIFHLEEKRWQVLCVCVCVLHLKCGFIGNELVSYLDHYYLSPVAAIATSFKKR